MGWNHVRGGAVTSATGAAAIRPQKASSSGCRAASLLLAASMPGSSRSKLCTRQACRHSMRSCTQLSWSGACEVRACLDQRIPRPRAQVCTAHRNDGALEHHPRPHSLELVQRTPPLITCASKYILQTQKPPPACGACCGARTRRLTLQPPGRLPAPGQLPTLGCPLPGIC